MRKSEIMDAREATDKRFAYKRCCALCVHYGYETGEKIELPMMNHPLKNGGYSMKSVSVYNPKICSISKKENERYDVCDYYAKDTTFIARTEKRFTREMLLSINGDKVQ